MWKEIGLLSVAGAIGTVSRFLVASLVLKVCGTQFPWGTVVVNLTGCFLFGLIWAVTEGRLAVGAQMRLILLTGFMGAFTTFSTYAFETSQLMLSSRFGMAAINGLGQLFLGLILMLVGLAIGRMM